MGLGFSSFEIARSGLFVNERGLYVTGHNISNVNTPGYVRQQAIITTGPYENLPAIGQKGLGADIEQIRQIRHSFIDNIYRQESNALGYWETRNKAFEDIQSILGEPFESGLQTVMNQFWDSWHELSKNPESLTVRSLVRQRAESFVQHVNHIGLQLDKLQNDTNSEIMVRINEVNDITKQIAALNVEILKVEVSKDSANDYRDQRNSLLDRLSKLVNVEIHENIDGQVDITANGYYIVSKGTQSLFVAEQQQGGLFCVPRIEGTDIEVTLKGGIIKGLLESRGEVLGTKGSIENGSPNTKADIVFAIDLSNTSDGYIDNVKASAQRYVEELEKRGIDYNLRLVTFGNNVILNNNFGSDKTDFINAVNLLNPTADTDNNFGDLVTALDGISDFRENANRYALVFTQESIGGELEVSGDDFDGYVNTLIGKGIKTSIITDSAWTQSGSHAGEAGWQSLADATAGELYDINSQDYDSLMNNMVSDINNDVNRNISIVEDTKNIIPELKKKLNALVNILVREINYLHKSGKTLGSPPSSGMDFFVPIDKSYPLQMGNIKLNDNLSNLNNIVASESGIIGDNTIAQKIANLRNSPLIDDAKGTLDVDDYYQKIILAVGYGGSEAANITQNQIKLVQSSDDYRQSIMAVSMDEELSNMMKYKFAYGASARLMNVIDDMLETIILRIGLVGR